MAHSFVEYSNNILKYDRWIYLKGIEQWPFHNMVNTKYLPHILEI